MYNLIPSHQSFCLIIYSHPVVLSFSASFQKAAAKITCNSFFPNLFGKKLLQYGSMGVWTCGSYFNDPVKQPCIKGFRELLTKTIFLKKHFHTPILPSRTCGTILAFGFSKFFFLFNKLSFAHQKHAYHTLTPSHSHTCFSSSSP